MGFWGMLAKNILRDVIAPEVEVITRDLITKVAASSSTASRALQAAEAAVDEVRSLRKQMATAMALDPNFKEGSKVILLARIGDQDRVKILDIKPMLTPAEYKDLVERLKSDFGVPEPSWVGHDIGPDDVEVGVLPLRRGVRAR